MRFPRRRQLSFQRRMSDYSSCCTLRALTLLMEKSSSPIAANEKLFMIKWSIVEDFKSISRLDAADNKESRFESWVWSGQ